jgi:MGT family glycosyltransferase
MAHYAVVCPEAGGHLFPMGCLGNALRHRGHQVTLVARSTAASIAQKLELPMYELPEDHPVYRFPSRVTRTALGLVGLRVLMGMRRRLCFRSEVVLETVPTALKELGVDGLIVDQNLLGGGSVAEHLGIPFVTACSAMHWLRDELVPPNFVRWNYADTRFARQRNRAAYAVWDWYMQPTVNLVNRYRAAWNLAPLNRLDEAFSPLAYLCQTCREFDFPRSELPNTFHYVGALAADRPKVEDDFPWDQLDGRPLTYVTLGTVHPSQDRGAIGKIASACAGIDTQLVISTGRWEDRVYHRDNPRNLPGKPLVMDFVPQMAILERAQLLITHGGVNTVLEALTRGVPMLILPRGADQPSMAARVTHSGVGLCASFQRFRPAQLRTMVARLLTDQTFRQRANKLQQAMAGTGGVARAAEIAEKALTTLRPVCRESTD